MGFDSPPAFKLLNNNIMLKLRIVLRALAVLLLALALIYQVALFVRWEHTCAPSAETIKYVRFHFLVDILLLFYLDKDIRSLLKQLKSEKK